MVAARSGFIQRLWAEEHEDFKHHKQTINNEQIFKFLAQLNIEFDEVREKIIGRKPLLTTKDVFSKVREMKVVWMLDWEKELHCLCGKICSCHNRC